MSGSPLASTGFDVRVVVDAAWLEFMIDGEGDYFVHAHGRVIETAHERLKPVQTLELQLGNYDALGAGLHILGPRGSARIIREQEQIEALRALLDQAAEPGAHLIAGITSQGPGTERASGRAYSWGSCNVSFELVHGTPPDISASAAFDPEDAANIRAELELISPPRDCSSAAPLKLSGEVTTLSGVDIPDFDRLKLHLDPSASKGRLQVNGPIAELTWPTPEADSPHILAMLQRANESGRLLADIDVGAKALDEAGTLWPVTDVSLMAQALKP